jgi:hypothetical protein
MMTITIAVTNTTSVFPTGEAKTARMIIPSCRTRPKWAASPSDAAPEIFFLPSVTVLPG